MFPSPRTLWYVKTHWKLEEVDNLGYNKRPMCPPTIFDCVPLSQRPTPAPKQRPTKRAHSPTRNQLPGGGGYKPIFAPPDYF